MTLSEYRRNARRTMESLFGEESGPLCDVLLENFLDYDRSELLSHGDDSVSDALNDRMGDAIDQLGYGVPVQYILGNCWFYGRKILVGKGVFIPRSDTESLVRTAIAALPQNGYFCDICTGSGCISAAIAEQRPDAHGAALDLSLKALSYAEKNLEPFPQIILRRFDALDEDDYLSLREQIGRRADLIVCNPPYIRREDITYLSQQVQYEPANALDGGEDGLTFYRAVIQNAPLLLTEHGVLAFELGIHQDAEVAALLQEAGWQTALVKDLHGVERVIVAKKD